MITEVISVSVIRDYHHLRLDGYLRVIVVIIRDEDPLQTNVIIPPSVVEEINGILQDSEVPLAIDIKVLFRIEVHRFVFSTLVVNLDIVVFVQLFVN